jgi:DNA helicase II / ATP-dependent DNA helicase PcrA
MSDILLKNLNPEQRRAVTYGDGPLLIVAGAGTGKTTVITQRVAWLIAQGKAESDEILTVTFTDKAAGEMSERVDKLLPLGYLDLWISTFHSFCQRVLQDHAVDIGLSGDFKLLDQTSQWLLIRQHLDRFNLDYYRPLGNPTKFIHSLLKHFSRAKDEAVWPEDYLEYVESLKLNQDAAESTGNIKTKKYKNKKTREQISASTKATADRQGDSEIDLGEISRLEEIANAYHVYQQILLESNALDFGDLINYTLQLFQKRPKILAKYKQQFRYILVDEFQDTNWAQYELIKLLAAPKNNLTLVGDDEQSVYKFRGASISNILQFHKDYPKTEFVTLTTNYRSRQYILDRSHKFIQLNNPNRLEGQIINGKKINKKLRAVEKFRGREKIQHQENEIIKYLLFEDQYDEALGVVQKIMELKQKDKAATYNDFAVLIRANSQAENFISFFENSGLPYQYVASRGLYTKPVILDVVNFLKLLDDYHESPSLWRVLNWPVFDFKSQTLVGISHYAKKKAWSLYQALHWWQRQGKIDEVERNEISKVIALIEKHTKLAQHKKPREIILSFLEDSGYLKWLANQEEYQAEQQIKYLDQFDRKLKEFETQVIDPSIKLLLAELNMELESGEAGSLDIDLEAGPEMVKLLTIHAAKGLEFKYVFIVNMVDKRFPAIERRDPIELPDELVKEQIPEGNIHLQEERRLMYVAMTRAKEQLYLTGAKDYGGKTKKKPSRFLHELELVGKEKEMDKIKDTTKAEPRQTETANYQIPKRFSFTQLKSFENCPYQYRFAHILKVPIRANFTLSFGKTMHATLKRFIDHFKTAIDSKQGDLFNDQGAQNNKRSSSAPLSGTSADKSFPDLKELLKIYEEEWIDDWYESDKHKEEYRSKGKQILKDFHAKIKQDPPSVYYLEQGFNLKIHDPKSNKVYSFFGVIDRVDKVNDEEVEIIDYKTGAVKSEKYVDKDQLFIYQIAAVEALKLKPKKLTFYYLNENKPVSFLGSDEDLEKMKKKILDFAEKVQASDFRATPSPMKCKYCDYRNICEYRAL